MTDGNSALETLTGIIERVTFHNPDNGFAVLKVAARGHRDLRQWDHDAEQAENRSQQGEKWCEQTRQAHQPVLLLSAQRDYEIRFPIYEISTGHSTRTTHSIQARRAYLATVRAHLADLPARPDANPTQEVPQVVCQGE